MVEILSHKILHTSIRNAESINKGYWRAQTKFFGTMDPTMEELQDTRGVVEEDEHKDEEEEKDRSIKDTFIMCSYMG